MVETVIVTSLALSPDMSPLQSCSELPEGVKVVEMVSVAPLALSPDMSPLQSRSKPPEKVKVVEMVSVSGFGVFSLIWDFHPDLGFSP